MNDQAPLDATLHAFKKRDKRFVLIGAAVAYYLAVLSVGAVFIALTWGLWGEAMRWYFGVLGAISSGVEPAAPPQHLMIGLLPYYLATIPIGLLLFAAFEAACLRWLVRGESGGGLFGLRLDSDTWRVFGVYWLWIAYFLCVVIAIALFYAVLVAIGGIGGAARLIAMLAGALAPLGILALLVWGGVLFAPAAAASVGRRKLTFLSARKISAPRFWPLLTSFVLVMVGYLIASTVLSTILQIPVNQAMAPVVQSVVRGGDGAQALALLQEALLTPPMIGVIVVNVLASLMLATVYYIAMFGVNARAFDAALEAGDASRG